MKLLLHFIVWIFLAPWAASTFCICYQSFARMRSASPVELASVTFGAAIFALFGVLYCSRFTLPASVLVAVLLKLRPQILQGLVRRISFVVTLALVGGVIGNYANLKLQMDEVSFPIIAIGAGTGMILGICTLRLWNCSVIHEALEKP